MKAIYKIIMTLALVSMIHLTVDAQRVSMIGVRAGYPFGMTFKTPFDNNSNLMFEGIVGTRGNSISFTGLFEGTIRPGEDKRFEMYFGGGGHVGFYGTKGPYWEDEPDPFLGIGIDGIFGFGWTFANAPVNLTFDYKPAVNFVGPSNFWYGDAAVSVRYVFR